MRRAGVIASGADAAQAVSRRISRSAPDLSEKQAAVEALVRRLTEDLPPADERTAEQQATWLLAQLLDWHRREDKSMWWRYFEMLEMTDEELLNDREPIAGRDV